MPLNPETGVLVLCGAKSRRNGGAACRQAAMRNGRCRFHGGKSTGPKTEEGKQRCKMNGYKHGFYSQTAVAERKRVRRLLKEAKITSQNYL